MRIHTGPEIASPTGVRVYNRVVTLFEKSFARLEEPIQKAAIGQFVLAADAVSGSMTPWTTVMPW